MICELHGTLESVADGKARIAPGAGLTYEVLLPAYVAMRLGGEIDRPITLHTIHYLEGTSQGANFIPRLAGFLQEEDRAFFELFTSVKGIGPRKALRAMALSRGQIAAAIADRDVKTLQSLPEIGKRTAETIVAALHGRVDRFVSSTAYPPEGGKGEAAPTSAPGRPAAREALEVLLQLGENRAHAVRWIDEALTHHPDLHDPDQLIREALHIKTGGG